MTHPEAPIQRISICICTWNRSQRLAETLESLATLAAPSGVSWEVLVVDNNSTDDTAATLNAWRNRLPLTTLFEATPGLTWARNRALARATGDLVIWTDDDVLVDPQWMAAYASAAEQWPEASYFGGTINPLFDVAPPDWIAANLETLEGVLVIRQLGEESRRLKPGETPFGANMAFRRTAVAGRRFNTAIGHCAGRLIGGDDMNYIDALRNEGHWGVWVGSAKVTHHVPAERMTLDFLRRWCDDAGISCARQAFGSDPPKLFGLPRWQLRRYVETGGNLLLARMSGSGNWVTPFMHHRVLGSFLGEWRILNLGKAKLDSSLALGGMHH